MSNTEKLEAHLNNLSEWMKNNGRVAVAYSGGVDSTLVAAVASRALGDKADIIFCHTPLIARQEADEAVALADSLKFPLTVLELDPLALEQVRENHPDRCYFCKYHIFSQIAAAYPDCAIVDGTNLDDTFTDRPGLKALDQLNVKSPLAEQRITKKEIRALSKTMGLPNWDKPSAPCLATRFAPYATISLEALERAQEAEDIVSQAGFSYVRVRDHYPKAVIEVHPDEVKRLQRTLESVRSSLSALYQIIAVAPEGYPGSTD